MNVERPNSARSADTRARAEGAFKKAQKASREADKSQAMMEYEAEAQAERAKSARLRELRLARDAAARDEAAKARPAAKTRKRKTTTA